jgi:hypothetical protein
VFAFDDSHPAIRPAFISVNVELYQFLWIMTQEDSGEGANLIPHGERGDSPCQCEDVRRRFAQRTSCP